MRIVLLGATGRTGVEVIKQGLQRGHQVTVIVRDENKLKQAVGDDIMADEKLIVSEANIFSGESLKEVCAETDVIMSTLGFTLMSRPVTGYTNATKAMVEAIQGTGKRLVLMHSWFSRPDSRNEYPNWLFRKLFLGLMIGPVLDDMDRVDQFLETDELAKDVQYTLVLPPGLKNGPVTDKTIHAEEDVFWIKDKETSITRSDVARFMLDALEKPESYQRKRVAISY